MEWLNTPRPVVDACWEMMPRLQAEEALHARGVAVHPHLERGDQREALRALEGVAQLTTSRKATKGDIARMGIKIEGGGQDG